MEGAGIAAGMIVGGEEGLVGGEDLGQEEVEVVEELVLHCGDVGDGCLSEDEGGVVVVGACVLDEQQTGRDGICCLPHIYDGIEEGLEVVVAMISYIGGVEDRGDIGERLRMIVAGLVVDDTDLFCAVRQGNLVDSVGNTAQIDGRKIFSFENVLATVSIQRCIEGEDGEGGDAEVNL